MNRLGPLALLSIVTFGCESTPVPMSDIFSSNDAAAPAPTSPTPDQDAAVAPQNDSSVPDANDLPDVPSIPKKPGSDAACLLPLAWWTVSPTFDVNATPVAFANAINPLIGPQHVLAIADYLDQNNQWTLRATATLTDGNFQQYFPFDHPGDVVSMARQQGSFSSGSSVNSAWILIVDSANVSIWVPIVSANVSADYADAYCQSLTNGKVDAVVPASASVVTLTTGQGPTTLGALLGAYTSSTPLGWSVRLTFGAQKVQVSSK
jgi:hypothetical protein